MKKIRNLNPAVVTQNAQLKALESVLLKTHEFFERKVRRWFSKQYSTPYMDTFNIPWEELLLHYYEAGIENLTYNEVYDLAVSEYLPEFIDQAEEEDEEFAKALQDEQDATVAKKKARDDAKAKLEAATSQMQAGAATVVDKVQSLNKALDQKKLAKTINQSKKFDDEGDPEA
jgi:primosomal protein N'